jgi:hypothetical protein
MDDIKKLYDEHLRAPFPPDLAGEEILGVELVLVDADTAGLTDKYISDRGQLTVDDFRILSHCYSDLKVIAKELKGTDRQYFARLQNIAGLIIENIKNENVTRDKKLPKPEWETIFLKIKEILHDWDPLGVPDSVDDEYDTMNFRLLSVLMNKGDRGEIRNILDDYTRNVMQLTVDNDTLDRVTDRISKIS